jgi:hypothetical protein
VVPSSRLYLGDLYSVNIYSDSIHYSLFTTIPRPKLESFVASASRAPLLGLFGVLVKEWVPLIDEYYYCTFSGSLVPHLPISPSRYCTLTILVSSLFSVVAFVMYQFYTFDV